MDVSVVHIRRITIVVRVVSSLTNAKASRPMASNGARVDDDWNHRATVCAVGAAVGAPPVLPPICFLSLISRLTWHATKPVM